MPRNKKVSVITDSAIKTISNSENNQPVVIPFEPKPIERVLVSFRVTQCGKHPFTMQHSIEAPSETVTYSGLAKKTAFAIADSLYTMCEKALQAKEKHGYYLTAFRPKSVFQVEVSVNGQSRLVCFNTKGSDAIRLVKLGKLVSRSLLVEKFELLSELSKATQTFADILTVENQIEAELLQQISNEKQLAEYQATQTN